MNATTQCVWLQGILWETIFAFDSRIVIWCDNQSEINISTYLVQRQRTKHIEIHMHYIQSLVHDHVIALRYFPSAEQTADIFTKCFTEKNFTYLRSILGVSDRYHSLSYFWLHVHFLGEFFFPCGFPPYLVSMDK